MVPADLMGHKSVAPASEGRVERSSPPGEKLRCRPPNAAAGGLDNDEGLEQHPARLGLHRLRVDGQEVIAEDALLLVRDLGGLQHVLAALRTRGDERHGRPGTIVDADSLASRAVHGQLPPPLACARRHGGSMR